MSQLVIREDFDSWDSWIDRASDTSRTAWGKGEDAFGTVHKASNVAWFGTATFPEAVDLSRYGWPAGRTMMADAIRVVMPARDAAPVWRHDVAGAFPDVARAAAGDPMSMLSPVRSARSARPVVRINYGRATLSDVPSKAIINRGAALLGIIDALEADGYSVELRLVFKSNEDSSGYSATAYHSAVTVKRAGDPLDLDRAAFALVNPAVLRRLAFAMRQQHAALAAWAGNMGYTDYSPWIDDDAAAIFVPSATAADSDSTAARRAVEALFTGAEQ